MQAACHESLPPRGLSFSLFQLNRKHRLATAAKRCFKSHLFRSPRKKRTLSLGAARLAFRVPRENGAETEKRKMLISVMWNWRQVSLLVYLLVA
jgi:hypothetical protein